MASIRSRATSVGDVDTIAGDGGAGGIVDGAAAATADSAETTTAKHSAFNEDTHMTPQVGRGRLRLLLVTSRPGCR